VRRKRSQEDTQIQPQGSGRTGKASVLVVDDEDHILKLYQEELAEEGYRVTTATTGEQALRAAETESPDVVVLDIKLQDQSGLEILGGLRKLGGNRPIILNSAYSVYKNDFQSWLADAYLVKSSNLDELKKKIRELISI
jgi:DNA-binding response OmpR family regulator